MNRMEVINQNEEGPPMAEEGNEIAIDGTLYGVEDEREEEYTSEIEEEEYTCQRITEYKAELEDLANKKRKPLKPCQSEGTSSKKARQDDISGVSSAEMMELINFEMSERSKKKGHSVESCAQIRRHRRKGRRKGSKKELDEKVSRMLDDANLHYANRRYEMAIAVLKEVVRVEPNLPDVYLILGLVHSAIGDYEKEMVFYTIAAILTK